LHTLTQGDSLTIGFNLDPTYNIADLQNAYVWIGATKYAHTLIGRLIRVELKSSDTQNIGVGGKDVRLVIDDANFGHRETNCGYISVNRTAAKSSDASINNGYNLWIDVTITQTLTTTNVALIEAIKGEKGADGADGADGVGVPAGGGIGQVLAKKSSTDFDTEWVNGGGGSGGGDMYKATYDTNNDGIVDKSTGDKNGNDIVTTYATKSEVSGAIGNSHTHSNKSILDSIQEALTTALKSAYDGAVTLANGALQRTSKITTVNVESSIDNTHTHSNKSILDQIQEAFTTALKSAYDSAVTWVSTNGSNLLNHLSNTSNPHSVTASQVGLGNVNNTPDANKPISTATQTALDLKADDISAITKEATGFRYPDYMEVTFDNVTKKVKVSSTDSVNYPIELYRLGKKLAGIGTSSHEFNITPSANTSGNYHLYYDESGILTFNTVNWTFKGLMIAQVQWDSVTSKGIIIKETHGLMNWQAHEEAHDTIGTYIKSGGDMSGMVVGSTTASNKRPAISATIVKDEDCPSLLSSWAAGTYTQRYLSGAVGTPTKNYVSGQSDIIPITGGIPYYNQNNGTNWVQTAIPNNYYAKIFVLAIPVGKNTNSGVPDSYSQDRRFCFVQPQTALASLTSIQALTTSSITLGDSAALLSEYVYIGEIIIQSSNTANGWTIVSTSKLTGGKISQSTLPTITDTGIISQETDAASSGTIAIGANVRKILSTTLTNAHAVTISPTAPASFTGVKCAIVDFTIGATSPSLTFATTGVTFTWMGKAAPTSPTVNKKHQIVFIWDDATNLKAYYEKSN
jgi:hypothetical protein